MMNKAKHKIPWAILFNHIEFFDSYDTVIRGEAGTLFKCDTVDWAEILKWGNTTRVTVACEYAPEIRHESVFVSNRNIRPASALYDLYQKSREIAS